MCFAGSTEMFTSECKVQNQISMLNHKSAAPRSKLLTQLLIHNLELFLVSQNTLVQISQVLQVQRIYTSIFNTRCHLRLQSMGFTSFHRFTTGSNTSTVLSLSWPSYPPTAYSLSATACILSEKIITIITE